MILFYNLEKARAICKSSYTLLDVLMWLTTPYKPAPRGIPSTTNPRSLKGNSWLLNVEDLYNDSTDISYKLQYIDLASRRSYLNYKHYGDASLQLVLYPEVLHSPSIKHNPLLEITGGNLHFKYER